MTESTINPAMATRWIEIPVSDFDRGKQFYEQVFQTDIEVIELGDLRMGTFKDSSVAICHHPQFYFPAKEGMIVYFKAAEDMEAMQNRVVAAGGEILIPWRVISPEQGSMALFLDSEGNRVGVRS
ncbi:VOC family protein [Neolewinella agarilytica]|uniref:Glyoxalase/fosfomycin resistance/dioxygenase domain-containing protein n=1 Tax=Neolewinella agarilytica TaxID=478744 RepID=A0A1H9CIK0_9BACT|nr:VOC family protein [Neolewinella agarilytica]SEQ00438.1 hypothetical protein SAMN05444359_104194 [Neolewinella agarilytica]